MARRNEIASRPVRRTLPLRRARMRHPVSLVEMAVIGFIIVVALYFGQAVFVPLALAVILSFILAPPVRVLEADGPAELPFGVSRGRRLAFAIIFGVGALITQQVASLAAGDPALSADAQGQGQGAEGCRGRQRRRDRARERHLEGPAARVG